MSPLIDLAMFGWIPAVLALFCWLPPRRAMITAFILAWLFLPVAGYKVEGIPSYDKVTATSYGVLLAVLIFDNRRLLEFRPRLIDLPMLIWCVCPMASSLANDLGPYDGFSVTLTQTVVWGIPYFIGRLYLRDLAALRELAIVLFAGGLVYVPLVLLELKISPQLHYLVYGVHQTNFVEAFRFGGWRPAVFMQHGLMVSMWMVVTATVGLGLWATRSLRQLWGMPVGFLAPALTVTAILCKSTGAIALLLLGAGAAILGSLFRLRAPLVLILLLAPAYLVMRTTGTWSGQNLVEWSSDNISEERGTSLEGRLMQEHLNTAKAMEKPIFGWSTWNVGADQLWVLAFRNHGLVGLTAFVAAFLLPAARFVRRVPPALYRSPTVAPALILTVVLVMVVLDSLFNAMIIPLYMLTAGGIAGATLPTTVRRRSQWMAAPRQIPVGASASYRPVPRTLPELSSRPHE